MTAPTEVNWQKIADEAERGYPPVVDPCEWEPHKPPNQPYTYQRVKRIKTVQEVRQELLLSLGVDGYGGCSDPGLSEYFNAFPEVQEEEWPYHGAVRVAVFAVRGGSEGDYVHVEEVRQDDRPSRCLILGKTFEGRDAAWTAARRIADLLGI